MVYILKFLHLLSLVVWIGGIIFFSLIAAPSIFKVLSRETAGDVVGDIFPKYWIMGYICSIMALLTLFIISAKENTLPKLRILILAIMLATTFYSGLVVGNKARQIKAQIRSMEDSPQRESLTERFKIIHRRSTILNGIVLLLGLTVIFLTAYQW